MQIATGGGSILLTRAVDLIPEATFWGDGRVVFAAGDGFIREGQVPPDAVRRLVRQGSVLYDLADHYTEHQATDLPTTHFTVETGRGRKTVSVYGFDPQRQAPEGEVTAVQYGDDGPRIAAAGPEPLRKLRQLLAAARAALPADAPLMEPEEVVVLTFPARGNAKPAGEWPPALHGRLKGAAAREAISLAGLGPDGVFRLDGTVRTVTVMPVLPVLQAPGKEWPVGGLPRHPEATLITGPDETYRFPGATRGEVAAWYRAAMVRKGWRLVKQDGDDLQVWVRSRFGNDPIVLLRFHDDHFNVGRLWVENGVPRHPDGLLGGCEGAWCQLVRGATTGDTAAWFRDYLGYLGWREERPNVFLNAGAGMRLELDLRAVRGGVAVTPRQSPVPQHRPLPRSQGAPLLPPPFLPGPPPPPEGPSLRPGEQEQR